MTLNRPRSQICTNRDNMSFYHGFRADFFLLNLQDHSSSSHHHSHPRPRIQPKLFSCGDFTRARSNFSRAYLNSDSSSTPRIFSLTFNLGTQRKPFRRLRALVYVLSLPLRQYSSSSMLSSPLFPFSSREILFADVHHHDGIRQSV